MALSFSGAGEDLGATRSGCPLDPFVVMHDKCEMVDQQIMKLQEQTDMVPVGELPRHLLLSADRYLTDKVMPGTRIQVVGVYDIFQSKTKVRSFSVCIQQVQSPTFFV